MTDAARTYVRYHHLHKALAREVAAPRPEDTDPIVQRDLAQRDLLSAVQTLHSLAPQTLDAGFLAEMSGDLRDLALIAHRAKRSA